TRQGKGGYAKESKHGQSRWTWWSGSRRQCWWTRRWPYWQQPDRRRAWARAWR
ncbi:hypothetical protein FBU31_007278, partial [Coemansia sp. 'formosensis']